MSGDPFWLLVSYLYVLVVLAIGTLAARGRRAPDVTRKIIHVGVGSWVIPTVLFFRSPWLAMIPPASFVLLNILSYRFRLVPAMEGEERNPGTIYFPLSFVILILLFWPGALFASGRPWLPGGAAAGPIDRLPVAAGIMVMAWGDAAASLIGRRFGRRRYRLGDGERSLEGSLALVLFGALGVATAELLLAATAPGRPPFEPAAARFLAAGFLGLITVLPAAVVEALSPRGLDNLLVPLTAALVAALAHHPA